MNWWQDGSPVFQRLCGFSQHPWWVAELPCCVRQFDEQSDTCLVMRAENRNVNTACPDLISKFSKSVMEGIPVAWMSPNLWYLLHPGIWYGYFRFLQSGLSSQKLDAIGSIGAREISNWYATWVISVNFPQTSQTHSGSFCPAKRSRHHQRSRSRRSNGLKTYLPCIICLVRGWRGDQLLHSFLFLQCLEVLCRSMSNVPTE